jgi:hypothetical protein
MFPDPWPLQKAVRAPRHEKRKGKAVIRGKKNKKEKIFFLLR